MLRNKAKDEYGEEKKKEGSKSVNLPSKVATSLTFTHKVFIKTSK